MRSATPCKALATLVLALVALSSGARAQCRRTLQLDLGPSGQPGNAVPILPAISPSGRVAFFASQADNLVPGDTNDAADMFRVDLATGVLERINVGPGGIEANAGHGFPFLSSDADGVRIAFASWATNLIPGDANGAKDVFVRDVAAGTTVRVSETASGFGGNQGSSVCFMSRDGNHVTFDTSATNFRPGDNNSQVDVFVRDLSTGALTLVSESASGAFANGRSAHAYPSGDGRWIVFESDATDLVAGGTSALSMVFVRDMLQGVTTQVTRGLAGTEPDGVSGGARISPDGRWILFRSEATNLVPDDHNGIPDLFLFDRQGGMTRRVNLGHGGVELAGAVDSFYALSDDGRFVTFATEADGVVPDDFDGREDVFRHDVWTGETLLVSRDDPSGGYYAGASGEATAFVFYGSFNNVGNNGAVFFHSLWPTPQRTCVARPNSTGSGARLAAQGAPDARGLLGPAFSLVASPVPDTPGLFLFGPSQIQVNLGDGLRCVGGQLRFLRPVGRGRGGTLQQTVDFGSPAAAAIVPGSTWHFQAWFRDPAAGGLGSNLSDGLRVEFCP